jgi:hypothetical protein
MRAIYCDLPKNTSPFRLSLTAEYREIVISFREFPNRLLSFPSQGKEPEESHSRRLPIDDEVMIGKAENSPSNYDTDGKACDFDV